MNRSNAMIEVDSITSPQRAPSAAYPSSILLAHGRLIGTPQRVTVAVDAQSGYAMRQALTDDPKTPVVAIIENGWQIVGWN